MAAGARGQGPGRWAREPSHPFPASTDPSANRSLYIQIGWGLGEGGGLATLKPPQEYWPFGVLWGGGSVAPRGCWPRVLGPHPGQQRPSQPFTRSSSRAQGCGGRRGGCTYREWAAPPSHLQPPQQGPRNRAGHKAPGLCEQPASGRPPPFPGAPCGQVGPSPPGTPLAGVSIPNGSAELTWTARGEGRGRGGGI